MSDSVSMMVPADEADLALLYGKDPPEDFVVMDAPGHVLWDNGMYVEVHVHMGMGQWRAVDTDETWPSLPEEVKAEYARRTGYDFPAPGDRLQRTLTRKMEEKREALEGKPDGES